MSKIVLASGYIPESKRLEEVRILLEQRGHTVALFRSGSPLLQHIQSNPVDVLVLSNPLGDVSGFEILDTVAIMDAEKRPKVVWMTFMSEYGVPAMNWDWQMVNAFLVAPFNQWHLLCAIEQLIYR